MPRLKSTMTWIVEASASIELVISPRMTHVRDDIVVDDLICAATWGGRDRIGRVSPGMSKHRGLSDGSEELS